MIYNGNTIYNIIGIYALMDDTVAKLPKKTRLERQPRKLFVRANLDLLFCELCRFLTAVSLWGKGQNYKEQPSPMKTGLKNIRG